MAKRAASMRLPVCVLTLAGGMLGLLAQGVTAQDGRGFWPQQRPSPNLDYRTREPLSEDMEKEAISLYSEARDALDAGNVELGQRRLERIVGRYPDTVTATIARRDLKLLYSRAADGRRNGAPPVPADATRGDSPVPRAPLPQGSGPASDPSPQQAQTPQVLVPLPPTLPPRGQLTGADNAAIDLANADLRMSAGDRLFFSDQSADIGTRSRGALEAIATWLRRYPGVEVVIEGHADDRGNVDFNDQVAEKRAEAVRARLIDLGIAPARIAAVGLGRSQPIADCREPQCSAQNRRVVVVVARVAGPFTGSGMALRPDLRPEAPGMAPPPGGGVTAVRR